MLRPSGSRAGMVDSATTEDEGVSIFRVLSLSYPDCAPLLGTHRCWGRRHRCWALLGALLGTDGTDGDVGLLGTEGAFIRSGRRVRLSALLILLQSSPDDKKSNPH